MPFDADWNEVIRFDPTLVLRHVPGKFDAAQAANRACGGRSAFRDPESDAQ